MCTIWIIYGKPVSYAMLINETNEDARGYATCPTFACEFHGFRVLAKTLLPLLILFRSKIKLRRNILHMKLRSLLMSLAIELLCWHMLCFSTLVFSSSTCTKLARTYVSIFVFTKLHIDGWANNKRLQCVWHLTVWSIYTKFRALHICVSRYISKLKYEPLSYNYIKCFHRTAWHYILCTHMINCDV